MIYAGLLLGLLGSLHCVGMCGPIALLLPLSKKSKSKQGLQLMLYHFGRISSYALLGLVFGIVGKGLSLTGWHQQISIGLGVLMILFVLYPKLSGVISLKIKPLTQTLNLIKKSLGLYLKNESFYASYLIGFLNGFLPCGMVYIALVGAVALNSLWSALMYMTLFGLGTVPLISVLVLAKEALPSRISAKFQQFIPVFVFIVGLLFVARGLGLEIPFISPGEQSMHLFTTPKLCP